MYGELGKRVLQGYNMRRITNKRNAAMCVCEEERERRGSIHSGQHPGQQPIHPATSTPLSLSHCDVQPDAMADSLVSLFCQAISTSFTHRQSDVLPPSSRQHSSQKELRLWGERNLHEATLQLSLCV